ncbi:MAG: phosphatase PAP2 family protein [Actinomycetota bacterium]|nr:phosphatase PAP2 family protein [Actinomycetota bacterium]
MAGGRALQRRMRRWQMAEEAAISVLPRRRRRGATWFGRLGDVVQEPPVWLALAAALAVGGGARGKRAALRGSVCFGAAALVANLAIKPLAGRSRPPGAGEGRPGPVTSSFPSGHTATDLAFSLGVAQEIPAVFIPLTGLTMAAHWSVVRSRGHYPSDVLVGGLVGVVVAFAAWKLWPPARRTEDDVAPGALASGAGDQEGRTGR